MKKGRLFSEEFSAIDEQIFSTIREKYFLTTFEEYLK